MEPVAPILTRVANDDELEAAVGLILCSTALGAQMAQSGDLLRLALAHRRDAGGVRIAVRGRRLISAVMPLASPGRTMLLFVPAGMRDEPGRLATQTLVNEVCEQAVVDGIELVQALLDIHDDASVEGLTDCSFRRLAELLYLQTAVPRTFARPLLPPGLSWRRYSSQTHALFARTVLETYRESLDCPALNGLREINDVLAGHQATGEFDPNLWFVLCDERGGVGTLLLSRVSRAAAVELVYVGLAPEQRGRGLSDVLVRQAMATTSAAGCGRLSLAVDAENLPALKLYWRHGFQALGRKTAMLRDLRAVDVSLAKSAEPASVAPAASGNAGA